MAVDKNKVEEDVTIRRFQKIVLSWDYIRLLKESEGQKNNKKIGSALGLKEVKDTYKDVDDYLATFEPLLFEEVKAQIIQGRDEEEETECKNAIVLRCSKADPFHEAVLYCEHEESISQNDLLLLSTKKFGEGKEVPTTYAFAWTEHRQYDQITLRMHLGGEIKKINANEVETCPRLINVQSFFGDVQKSSAASEVHKHLYILKICSLSTIAREYIALRSISSLIFRDLILKASESNSNSEDRSWKISGPLMEFIESSHNKSQLEAIHAGLSRKTFVLIQGPPGTGKTQTILGVLSAILHATPARVHSNKDKFSGMKRGPEISIEEKYNHWGKASPWLIGSNPRDLKMPEDGNDGFFPTSGNEMKPEVVNSKRKYRVRVLVCAPSNSALDEIVLRLLNTGIRDENNRPYTPKIVRIGLKPHHSVQAVSMDYLLEQKLAGMDFQIGDKHKQGGAGKDKDNIRASILDEAAIVFSTLSFSGSALFSKLNRGFDVVIIDEAAQAVGDPVQLPATVISPIAEKFGYGMSLFKRFQRAGYPVLMLKTQYRMHPEIRNFPSREFYDEALEDGPDVQDQTIRSWHEYRCFGPFCFFDIHEGQESQPSGSGSWENVDEVEFVLLLYHELVTRHPELKSSARLAIISPYRHQIKLFRERFHDTFGVESHKVVDINTVDGFQGREKDVAIFSCVRASKDRGIGFVADFRRMNVGITRARSSVLVVGSASTLRKDKHWQNLVESAEKRNCLLKVSKPYTEFFSEENLRSMRVQPSEPDRPEFDPDNMEINVPMDGNVGDADQAQPEYNDWGDADGDAGGYDGGYDED